jgi:hypothetical protein
MKKMLLAVLSALCVNATAQITITAATFPVVGDTLRYAIDLTPGNDDFVTPPGGGQVWDFTNLNREQTVETIYRAPNTGNQSANYPGAELLVIGGNGESYYNVTNNKVELLGYAGGDPANLGVDVLAKFAPPIIDRRSPLMFFDINQQTSDLTLPFSTDALPDSLLANIPGASLIDSIRVRINFQRLEVADGWGTLRVPGMNMPENVLREKRTEYTTTALDVHSFLGWIPLPSTGGGGGLGNFLGTDTTVTYRYYSNIYKEDLAIVTVSNDGSTIEGVRFKNFGNLTPAPEIDAPGAAGVQAFPNPAVQWVRFDCTNLPPDDYTLKIFNIVGKVVWKNTYTIAGNRSIRVDLDDFKKGTYLYSLVDPEGVIIGTKRLVVVKP